ncbi:hypothetical protein C8R44DRAFT_741439 [Mycena epipterygia]|nr:hypothetical protein C8R44DRAFT_741439 [Mycena epipterygia]
MFHQYPPVMMPISTGKGLNARLTDLATSIDLKALIWVEYMLYFSQHRRQEQYPRVVTAEQRSIIPELMRGSLRQLATLATRNISPFRRNDGLTLECGILRYLAPGAEVLMHDSTRQDSSGAYCSSSFYAEFEAKTIGRISGAYTCLRFILDTKIRLQLATTQDVGWDLSE